MTNDTSYRQKGRAVFLAAIMVLSVVAASAALTGGVAASHAGSSYDVEVQENQNPRVWDGQTIRFNFTTDDTYTVTGPDGSDLGDFDTDASGNHTLDSSTLPATGEYTVEDSSGSTVTNFTLTTQTLSASFGDSSINSGQNTTVTLDTNRAENFTVVASSDGADVSTVFGDQNITEVKGGLGTSTTVNATTAGLAAGTYNFTFEAHDSDASATATITVEEGTDEDATFDSQSYSTVVGDTTSFDLETMGQPDEVWLNISDDEGYYTATVLLNNTNYDDDNTLSLTWNTHNASQNGSTLGLTETNGDATVNVVNAEGAAIMADNLLNRSSTYTFESFVDDPMGSGEFRDVSSVRVNERSNGPVTVWTAPSSTNYGTLNASELVGASTQDNTIANDDLLVLQVETNGVYGYMADDLANFNTTGGLNLTLTETNTGPYSDGATVNIQDISGNSTLIKQPGEGQFLVAIDTAQVGSISAGSSWDAAFSIHESNPYVDSTISSTASLSVEERSLEITGDFSDGTLQLPNSDSAEVTAESNVAPGTAVNVRMNFPFQFVTTSGEIADDGTFSSAVNLSQFEAGTQFDTRVSLGTGLSKTVGSVITESGDGPTNATASFSVSANAPSEVEQGAQAQLGYSFTNDGDADGTVEYTVTVNGEEVDSGTANLSAGSSTSPMVYEFDTSSAGDVEWSVSTQHDSASGTLTVAESGGDDTGGDDTGGDDTGGDDTGGDTGGDDTGGDGDGDSDGDGGGQPGFGLVVALFALIGAALLALRRQN
ncbi:surface glycoprotein [Salinarchaeum sp. Harcht-Bsk1]|uniref:surface glycoprotein n=1 Tax=Salinarchaeum sp. Harcht-Bsk1 TaxID=1333523 RepID=UPI0009DC434F|nr:surface glycoprotein [Salinarchaeum sp. Harcht-Bsk1]